MKKVLTFGTKNWWLSFVIVQILMLGCKNAPNPAATTATTTNSATNSQNSVAQKQVFKLQIDKPQSEEFEELYELILKDTVLQDFINSINRRIDFPNGVTIKIEECGEDNAFYNADSSKISICYEFIEHMMRIQDESIPENERLLHATAFTFLHEMGHALVDKLDLPITGKEENAVDELAMVILMSDTTDQTFIAAIEGAAQFYYDALNEDLHEFPFYDTHAPSLERYYDMLAIIVGAEPDTHKDLVGKKKDQLHPDRAEHAEYDYAKKKDSWRRILGKAWKD